MISPILKTDCLYRHLIIAACGVAWVARAPARTVRAEDKSMPGVMTHRLAAPEFPRGFTWWNTDRPLTFSGDLKGRVVVLDFWTYCCINCINNLANLEKVEEHFKGKPVVVVGVHSNKFTNEAETANIRTAILRYRVKHPVIVDQDHRLWTAYGVTAWPTLIFIDSEGHIAGGVSGEVQPEEIEKAVQTLLDEGRQHGTLAEAAPMLHPEAMVHSASGLAFPGKITADPAGGRLFIADSGHHRILATDRSGRLLQIIGAGVAGNADGPAEEAMFNDPQGLACDREHDALYVADLGNHLIRRVDLKAGRVETILGSGSETYDRVGGACGTEQGLDSPWDVALAGGALYIAMAGVHQIWRMDLETRQAEAWAGSGRENLKDGPGPGAELAQPSGLAALGEWLYFADSEVSALRRARLQDGDVETLVGHGLFDFGDADGPYGRARLQHPLGVATDGRDIFIADAYNHKIKRVNLEERSVRTLAGSGKPGTGQHQGPPAFYEPGGLTWMEGWLFVADTNNHRVVVFDPARPEIWHELAVREPRLTPEDEAIEGGYPVTAEIARNAEALELTLDPALVEGFHVNTEAPRTVVIWEPEGQGGRLLAEKDRRAQCTVLAGKFPADLAVPIRKQKGDSGRFIIDLSFASCTTGDAAICKPEVRRWDVSWKRTEGPAHRIRLMGGMIGTR